MLTRAKVLQFFLSIILVGTFFIPLPSRPIEPAYAFSQYGNCIQNPNQTAASVIEEMCGYIAKRTTVSGNPRDVRASGVTVTYIAPDGSHPTTTTDSQGLYRFTNIKANGSLKFSLTGYADQTFQSCCSAKRFQVSDILLLPVTVCSDGIDNDADGKIDFPTDTGCADAQDDSEADTCSIGQSQNLVIPKVRAAESCSDIIVKVTDQQTNKRLVGLEIKLTGPNNYEKTIIVDNPDGISFGDLQLNQSYAIEAKRTFQHGRKQYEIVGDLRKMVTANQRFVRISFQARQTGGSTDPDSMVTVNVASRILRGADYGELLQYVNLLVKVTGPDGISTEVRLGGTEEERGIRDHVVVLDTGKEYTFEIPKNNIIHGKRYVADRSSIKFTPREEGEIVTFYLEREPGALLIIRARDDLGVAVPRALFTVKLANGQVKGSGEMQEKDQGLAALEVESGTYTLAVTATDRDKYEQQTVSITQVVSDTDKKIEANIKFKRNDCDKKEGTVLYFICGTEAKEAYNAGRLTAAVSTVTDTITTARQSGKQPTAVCYGLIQKESLSQPGSAVQVAAYYSHSFDSSKCNQNGKGGKGAMVLPLASLQNDATGTYRRLKEIVVHESAHALNDWANDSNEELLFTGSYFIMLKDIEDNKRQPAMDHLFDSLEYPELKVKMVPGYYLTSKKEFLAEIYRLIWFENPDHTYQELKNRLISLKNLSGQDEHNLYEILDFGNKILSGSYSFTGAAP